MNLKAHLNLFAIFLLKALQFLSDSNLKYTSLSHFLMCPVSHED
jgi:hypothetical protein